MNAETLTTALGGRWRGSYGTARCPSHDDRTPSLSIRDGDGDRLLTYCHAGCPPDVVWVALRDRGLIEQGGDWQIPRRRSSGHTDSPAAAALSSNREHALRIWHNARRAENTVAQDYLRKDAAKGVPDAR